MERARSQCSKESPAIVNDLQYDLEKVSMDTNADHLNSDTLEMDRERSLSITFLGDENGGGMPHSFSLPSNQQNSCFQNISAPGIAELLGSDGTQQKYFSASRREEELNSELIRSHEKIRQLEAKVKSLFHENERIKNELEVLRLSIVSDNNERSSSQQPRYWTAYEHKRFLDALQLFGEKNKKAISIYVGSRNVAQIRSHLQKYRLRMNREARDDPVSVHKHTTLPEPTEERILNMEVVTTPSEIQTSGKPISHVTPLPNVKSTSSEMNNNNYQNNPFSFCVYDQTD